MQNNQLLTELRNELTRHADEVLRAGSQRYFKEEIKCYGLKSTTVDAIGKQFFAHVKHLPKADIFELCGQLWQSGYIDESFIACHWSYALRKQYEPSDMDVFERWIAEYVTNWASCDTLCNHTVGTLVELYPPLMARLKAWTHSDNRWTKRAAAVSLIVPAKRGLFMNDVFEIADTLMMDPDDMVQKGYGWMLKVTSQTHPQEVFEYVMSHKGHMPRTALRYAIEKLPPLKRAEAMVK